MTRRSHMLRRHPEKPSAHRLVAPAVSAFILPRIAMTGVLAAIAPLALLLFTFL